MPRLSLAGSAVLSEGVGLAGALGLSSALLGNYVADGYVATGYFATHGDFADSELEGTIVLDDTLAGAAVPAPGTVTTVGYEVYVNDSRVPHSRIQTCQIDFSESRTVQAFGLELFALPDEHLGGTIAAYVAGDAKFDIYGIYRTSTGVKRVKLITRGQAFVADRTSHPNGSIETWAGTDAAGRVDNKSIVFRLPAGHGFTRREVIELLLKAAGETHYRLTPDLGAMSKEVAVLGGDAITTINQMLDVKGRILQWDKEGVATDIYIGRDDASAAVADYTEDHLLGEIRRQTPQGVITQMTLTGNKKVQIGEVGPDGASTLELRSITETEVGSMAFEGRQESDGSLTDLAPPSVTPTKRRTRLVVTAITRKCGAVVRVFSQTFEYSVPEAARYSYNTGTSTWDAISGVYVQAGTLADDQNPAYLWPTLRWTKIAEKETRYYYDESGFRAASVPGPDSDAFAGSTGDGSGNLLGSQTTVKRYYNKRRALKDGPPVASWEEEDYVSGVKRLGSFEGVVDSAESLQLTERVTEVFESDEDGFVTRHVVYREGIDKTPGNDYWYGNGETSSDQSESLLVVSQVEEVFDRGNGIYHDVVTTTKELGKAPVTVTAPESGAPPAVDRLGGLTDEERDGLPEGVADDCGSQDLVSQPIKATVDATQLEESYPENHQLTSLDWAESEDELLAAARFVVDEALADQITVEVPANFLLRPGMVVNLRARQVDWNGRAKIEDVSHSFGWGQMATTRLGLKVYPDKEAA